MKFIRVPQVAIGFVRNHSSVQREVEAGNEIYIAMNPNEGWNVYAWDGETMEPVGGFVCEDQEDMYYLSDFADELIEFCEAVGSFNTDVLGELNKK